MGQAEAIFGLGNQQRSTFLSSVERVNCIVEQTENGRQPLAVLGLPGLVRHAATGDIPARNLFVKKGQLTFYMAVGNSVLAVNPNGTFPVIATLPTDSGPVWMDDNGTQLFINDGVTAQIYTYSTGVATAITSINYPVGARGGVFLQGRFWVYVTTGPNAGRAYASNQYDGLTWDGLNFITPSAKPTGIVGLDRWNDDLVIRGNSSIEWWTGTPTPIAGALGFQLAAAANTSIGSSAERGSAKVGGQFLMIGEYEGGGAQVFQQVGYQLAPVSTPKVDEDLARLQTQNAICTGYVCSGHPIFQVTIPGDTKAGAITWVYDLSTKQWSRRESHEKPYYRGLFAVGTNSKAYITDAFNGNIYRMDETAYDEDGEILPFEVTSIHLLKEGDTFTINSLQLDIATGLANPLPPGDDPHAILRVSKDGGHTWCMERYVTLGKMGQYTARARETEFGSARDWAFNVRITEPVPRRLSGAYLNLEAAA